MYFKDGMLGEFCDLLDVSDIASCDSVNMKCQAW